MTIHLRSCPVRPASHLQGIKGLCIMLAGVLLSLFLSGCRPEGEDGPVDMSCTDIMTFEGNVDGGATFSFRMVDDSPLISLTAPGQTLETGQVKAGERLLVRYIPESNRAYTSGAITLQGMARITQGSVATEWKDDYAQWDRDPVYLYSAWRSGKWLNLHVRLTYSTEPRLFALVLDPSTSASEWPELYLVHAFAKDIDGHDRAYYASFDLSTVWDNSSVKGVKVHIADSNLDKHIFTFSKTSATTD